MIPTLDIVASTVPALFFQLKLPPPPNSKFNVPVVSPPIMLATPCMLEAVEVVPMFSRMPVGSTKLSAPVVPVSWTRFRLTGGFVAFEPGTTCQDQDSAVSAPAPDHVLPDISNFGEGCACDAVAAVGFEMFSAKAFVNAPAALPVANRLSPKAADPAAVPILCR